MNTALTPLPEHIEFAQWLVMRHAELRERWKSPIPKVDDLPPEDLDETCRDFFITMGWDIEDFLYDVETAHTDTLIYLRSRLCEPGGNEDLDRLGIALIDEVLQSRKGTGER